MPNPDNILRLWNVSMFARGPMGKGQKMATRSDPVTPKAMKPGTSVSKLRRSVAEQLIQISRSLVRALSWKERKVLLHVSIVFHGSQIH